MGGKKIKNHIKKEEHSGKSTKESNGAKYLM